MIVDFMILQHVEGWRRFLDEAFRVLRPGVEMYINDLTDAGVITTLHWTILVSVFRSPQKTTRSKRSERPKNNDRHKKPSDPRMTDP